MIIDLLNRLLCRIQGHNIDDHILDYDPYTGQEYLYCVSCKAHLPVHNLD